jgi:hypothetical protein
MRVNRTGTPATRRPEVVRFPMRRLRRTLGFLPASEVNG